MIEVPLNWILINPVVDILLFMSISYFFLFRYYKFLLNNDFKKISWVDLEVSIIFLALGYLNYADTQLNVFGHKFDWWFVVITAQLLVEGIFTLVYWKEFKIYLKKIKKSARIDEKERLEEMIQELNFIKKIMEEDIEKYRIQGNKIGEEKVKREKEKLENEIQKIEERLRDLNNKKND